MNSANEGGCYGTIQLLTTTVEARRKARLKNLWERWMGERWWECYGEVLHQVALIWHWRLCDLGIAIKSNEGTHGSPEGAE